MSKVNIADVTYPYINIRLEDDETAENVGEKLSRLYLYIDEHKNMGRFFTYGNAYKAIKQYANKLIGKRDIKISKRQVASLRKCYTILGTNRYIKIPFSLHYIFKAIFEIVDKLKAEYPLPHDLEIFVGEIRREIFYYEQSELFDDWYDGNKDELLRELHDDIFAGNAILSKKF
ncbi:MAG: hypothetical protein NC311_06865 [Muribaculaceae bacterium]|nr:hypothetical protein [Muribaculaceae bacterium]MCM1399001.1 hypothetical protein [Clostridium sp.]MCM1458859.1 hypothetical protein [Bacteroides sp.]